MPSVAQRQRDTKSEGGVVWAWTIPGSKEAAAKLWIWRPKKKKKIDSVLNAKKNPSEWDAYVRYVAILRGSIQGALRY